MRKSAVRFAVDFLFMRYVEVGGVRVSAIGLGTWQFGSREWGYGDEYAEREAGDITRRALNLGINLIDTAEIYAFGRSERIVGRAIEGRRDDVLVTPDGRLIGRLDPIFKKVSSLWETRIIQDRPDHVRVELVVTGDGLGPDEEASLTRELALRLGPAMHIDLVRVPRIPRTQAGKFRAVINLVAAQGEATAHS